jgi:tricorn protease
VLDMMLGELNASHMGYRPPNPAEEGEKTGWIGAVFDPTAGGPGILVREVLRDSPAARHDVRLEAGERLLAVNGQPVDERTNVYGLFADTVEQRLALTIRGLDGSERRAVVIPTGLSEERRRRYETWVRQRRALVDRLGSGRLGYLHIQGMSIPSFEEFERDLYAAASGKEGLVIDVRSNGGGWTTDYLLAVLEVRRHAFTVPRDGEVSQRAYPQDRLPLAAWTRPALTLCNEDSYSNAEIFSSAFRELGRGLVVGSPTFGAVISTDATDLLNGGTLRLPLRGWYVASSGAPMENNGVQPGVVVWQPPDEDFAADRDRQLERAVQEFLAGIDKDPRFGAW